MKKLRYTLERGAISGASDAAYLSDDEGVPDSLKESIWQGISLDVEVTIGDVTMFAAAWEDPAHWEADWVAKLGVEADEVPDAVAALLAAATTED